MKSVNAEHIRIRRPEDSCSPFVGCSLAPRTHVCTLRIFRSDRSPLPAALSPFTRVRCCFRLMRLSVSSLRLFIRPPRRDCALPAGNASCARVHRIIITRLIWERFLFRRREMRARFRGPSCCRDDCLLAQATISAACVEIGEISTG